MSSIHIWYQGQVHLQRSRSNIRVMFLKRWVFWGHWCFTNTSCFVFCNSFPFGHLKTSCLVKNKDVTDKPGLIFTNHSWITFFVLFSRFFYIQKHLNLTQPLIGQTTANPYRLAYRKLCYFQMYTSKKKRQTKFLRMVDEYRPRIWLIAHEI